MQIKCLAQGHNAFADDLLIQTSDSKLPHDHKSKSYRLAMWSQEGNDIQSRLVNEQISQALKKLILIFFKPRV